MANKTKKLNIKKLDTKKMATYGIGAAGATVAGVYGAKFAARKSFQMAQNNAMRVIMTDIYDENLYELVSSTSRLGIQEVAETNLRATEGKAISRPMGSPKKFPSLISLMFIQCPAISNAYTF